MNVVFMGTPDFGTVILNTLKDAGHGLVGVFCQPDKAKGRDRAPMPPPVKQCALDMGCSIMQPRRLGKKSLAALREMNPDVVIVAAYGRILPKTILEIPRFGCINVHASLLPKYRGAAPIHWALANGEALTGVTIMQMDEGLDTGDMLASQATNIASQDTASTLHDRLARIGADLLVKTLADVEAGAAQATPQEDGLATLAPILTREDGQVDWSWPAAKIADRVRGFYPWPGATTSFRGKSFKLFPFVQKGQEDSRLAPGTIASITATGLVVACGDGTVVLPHVQQAGKRRMEACCWASGARVEPGEKLGA